MQLGRRRRRSFSVSPRQCRRLGERLSGIRRIAADRSVRLAQEVDGSLPFLDLIVAQGNPDCAAAQGMHPDLVAPPEAAAAQAAPSAVEPSAAGDGEIDWGALMAVEEAEQEPERGLTLLETAAGRRLVTDELMELREFLVFRQMGAEDEEKKELGKMKIVVDEAISSLANGEFLFWVGVLRSDARLEAEAGQLQALQVQSARPLQQAREAERRIMELKATRNQVEGWLQVERATAQRLHGAVQEGLQGLLKDKAKVRLTLPPGSR
mmetsp:Transcript_104391/g.239063  ORF Transcript_104391/g.239063 Transcript_104391/m.239063 type:complete len:266 (+) Transcript_104391:581-1378(+)